MALTDDPSEWLFGFDVQGDVGPITYYTDARDRIVSFPRYPPLHPPSPTQQVFRDLLRSAASQWRALTPDQRTAWRLATRRCSSAITATAIWFYLVRTREFELITTMERISGIPLVAPT